MGCAEPLLAAIVAVIALLRSPVGVPCWRVPLRTGGPVVIPWRPVTVQGQSEQGLSSPEGCAGLGGGPQLVSPLQALAPRGTNVEFLIPR